MEEAARKHRQLAEAWDTLVAKARSLAGFEHFLRPKKFTTLLKAASAGAVVIVNVDESQCDALIVVPGQKRVIHVPLKEMSFSRAQELQRNLYRLLSDAGVRMRDTRGPHKVPTTTGPSSWNDILSTLWKNLVHPVLDALAISVSAIDYLPWT